MDEIRFELLDDRHNRGEFSCGKPSLDSYFHTHAKQHAKKGISRTVVACPLASDKVLGFYSMAASSVSLVDFPKAWAKRLPKHPIPSILLARLAVDRSSQGLGIGSQLLMEALRKSLEISMVIGVYGVHVHALDDDAAGFYSNYGFVALENQHRHMFLAIETIRQEFDE